MVSRAIPADSEIDAVLLIALAMSLHYISLKFDSILMLRALYYYKV
nr:MAG TPA: hypothetical protein [Herelleviridae sp.]DAI67399.1 MAG TPA: hypothetical protein [Caudoviricetes sp.]